MNHLLAVALFAILAPLAFADQGSFTNSGGSTSGSSIITSNVGNPAGVLSISGTGLTYFSNDGTTTIHASFTSVTSPESCSGGGKGGRVTCGYSFTGYFGGTLTVNGSAQAITGVTYQSFAVGGPATGTTAYNSAYTPFYYSDSEQILRSDDLQGTNQISYGSQGSGVGNFYGAYGVALDSAGRIYVADTYNCRIVRIDDMNGTNWTTYGGTCGSGQGQFSDPSGLAVDGLGKIYVMDTGNSRVVRMDDMTGFNWVSYGSAGTGAGQFAQYLTSIAVDAGSRIYIADTGNNRIVRMDDMTGANWTALTQSQPLNGLSHSFSSPVAIALDSAGKIYVADNEYFAPAVIRVDDMTGANWISIYTSRTSGGAGLNSIAVDTSGTVFTGGGGAKLVDKMTAVLSSSGTIGPVGSYYVFGVTPVPLPSPRPSAIRFSPPALSFSQNIGTTGSQALTIANFGGSSLSLSGISASGGFPDTSDCPNTLLAGSNCTVTVTFTPQGAGPVNGLLSVTDDSGNWGAVQAITLTGMGTAPAASVTPASLTFSSQAVGTTSGARTVTLQNTGTGPMQVSTVTAVAPFSQTNTCGASIGAGASCRISVSFTPTVIGSVSGTLTIADNAGTQTVALRGTGSTPVTLSASALNLGTVAVGATSAGQTVTVTNSGTVTNISVTVSGDFAVATTCASSLAAGTSCTATVTFTPSVAGTRTGTLTINLSTGAQTVSLTGTGSSGSGSQPGTLTLSPSPLKFSGYTIGDNPTRNVTVTNTNAASAAIAGIAIFGDPSLTQKNTCGPVLAAGATCAITVTFRPVAYGTFTGALTVTEGSGAQDSIPVTASSAPDN